MKMKKIVLAIQAMVFGAPVAGRFAGRMKTADVAYKYRMGAGFPGDVNRTHPASIEPVLLDSTDFPTAFGQLVVVTAAGKMRKIKAGDSATTIYGVMVRPYPTQAASAGQYGADALGASAPAIAGVHDVLRAGYIMSQLNSAAGAVVRGGPVFVWIGAAGGGHVVGGLESVSGGANTIALDPARYSFNGSADAAGVVELAINI